MRIPAPSVWFQVTFGPRGKYRAQDRVILHVCTSTFVRAYNEARAQLRALVGVRPSRSWTLLSNRRVPNEVVFQGGI